MPTVQSIVTIARSPAQVFAYATTPAYWPRWQPAALAVTGATDHPLQVGERVQLDYVVAGRPGQVVWTVKERLAPQRWLIEGQIAGRDSGGAIAYALAPAPGGTRFERTFTYRTHVPIVRVMDALALQRQVQAESDLALARLKHLLERNG